MRKNKIYNNFKDRFGNVYGFDNYLDFARFWFSIPFRHLQNDFPEFKKLQYVATSSKEAKTPYFINN